MIMINLYSYIYYYNVQFPRPFLRMAEFNKLTVALNENKFLNSA